MTSLSMYKYLLNIMKYHAQFFLLASIQDVQTPVQS